MSWAALQHGLAGVLVGAAVLLTLACALGLVLMSDPWQRLQFVAPPSTVGAALLAAGIALEAGVESAVKPMLVVLLLTMFNGVVTHALARAAYVRQHGHWPPTKEQR